MDARGELIVESGGHIECTSPLGCRVDIRLRSIDIKGTIEASDIWLFGRNQVNVSGNISASAVSSSNTARVGSAGDCNLVFDTHGVTGDTNRMCSGAGGGHIAMGGKGKAYVAQYATSQYNVLPAPLGALELTDIGAQYTFGGAGGRGAWWSTSYSRYDFTHGGAGGGRIKIVSPIVNAAGVITADGKQPTSTCTSSDLCSSSSCYGSTSSSRQCTACSCGGSGGGGSVAIEAAIILSQPSGIIRVNGADSKGEGGAGAGGFVLLRYDSISESLALEVQSGLGKVGTGGPGPGSIVHIILSVLCRVEILSHEISVDNALVLNMAGQSAVEILPDIGVDLMVQRSHIIMSSNMQFRDFTLKDSHLDTTLPIRLHANSIVIEKSSIIAASSLYISAIFSVICNTSSINASSLYISAISDVLMPSTNIFTISNEIMITAGGDLLMSSSSSIEAMTSNFSVHGQMFFGILHISNAIRIVGHVTSIAHIVSKSLVQIESLADLVVGPIESLNISIHVNGTLNVCNLAALDIVIRASNILQEGSSCRISASGRSTDILDNTTSGRDCCGKLCDDASSTPTVYSTAFGGAGGGNGGTGGGCALNGQGGGLTSSDLNQPWAYGGKGGDGANGRVNTYKCPPGGEGGGRIKIVSRDSLQICGFILAHGNPPLDCTTGEGQSYATYLPYASYLPAASGGGAGGSIQLHADKILGGGRVAANGGAGGRVTYSPSYTYRSGGAGAGGRISVKFASLTRDIVFETLGGSSPITNRQTAAGAGSVAYFEPADKATYIFGTSDDGTHHSVLAESLRSPFSLTLREYSNVSLQGAYQVDRIVLENYALLRLMPSELSSSREGNVLLSSRMTMQSNSVLHAGSYSISVTSSVIACNMTATRIEVGTFLRLTETTHVNTPCTITTNELVVGQTLTAPYRSVITANSATNLSIVANSMSVCKIFSERYIYLKSAQTLSVTADPLLVGRENALATVECSDQSASGACGCQDIVSQSGSGFISRGIYGSGEYCQWTIDGSGFQNVSVRFPSFITCAGSSESDYVQIFSCPDANCATTSLLATLQGSAVSPSTIYASTTGVMRITFWTAPNVTSWHGCADSSKCACQGRPVPRGWMAQWWVSEHICTIQTAQDVHIEAGVITMPRSSSIFSGFQVVVHARDSMLASNIASRESSIHVGGDLQIWSQAELLSQLTSSWTVKGQISTTPSPSSLISCKISSSEDAIVVRAADVLLPCSMTARRTIEIVSDSIVATGPLNSSNLNFSVGTAAFDGNGIVCQDLYMHVGLRALLNNVNLHALHIYIQSTDLIFVGGSVSSQDFKFAVKQTVDLSNGAKINSRTGLIDAHHVSLERIEVFLSDLNVSVTDGNCLMREATVSSHSVFIHAKNSNISLLGGHISSNKIDLKAKEEISLRKNQHLISQTFIAMEAPSIMMASETSAVRSASLQCTASDCTVKMTGINVELTHRAYVEASNVLIFSDRIRILSDCDGQMLESCSSRICASGRGELAGQGEGTGKDSCGSTLLSDFWQGGGGGGHGGIGADCCLHDGGHGKAYGNHTRPWTYGSGGGKGHGGTKGGSGGGRIKIEATDSVEIDGFVEADGLDGAMSSLHDVNMASGGGGAGGSIQIVANIIKGIGFVRANGGAGGLVRNVEGIGIIAKSGGEGAGGRISVGTSSIDDNLKVQVRSGARFVGCNGLESESGSVYEYVIAPRPLCKAGEFAPNITSSGDTQRCVQCKAGKYSSSAAASVCSACSAGTFSTGEGGISEDSCDKCQAGTYSSTVAAATANTCLPCIAGTYSEVSAATSVTTCLDCIAGKFLVTNGNDEENDCALCGKGRYSSSMGATSEDTCQSCMPGTYLETQGNSAQGDCLLCGKGTYSSSTGATTAVTCQSCISGTYSEASGATSDSTCILCIAGTYSTSVGAIAGDACSTCPDGMTSLPGSSTSSECAVRCQVGYFNSPNGICQVISLLHTICHVTLFCKPSNTLLMPQECPFMSSSEAGSESSLQCKCRVGYTGPDGNDCETCAGKSVLSKLSILIRLNLDSFGTRFQEESSRHR